MSNRAFEQAKETKALLDHYNSLAAAAKAKAAFDKLSAQDKVLFNQVNNPAPYICCPIAPIVLYPTGPISLSLSSGSAILSWSYVTTNQVGFDVFRSTNGVTFVTYSTAPTATDRNYTDSAVTTSITYSYALAAYNDSGSSAWSNVASIFFAPPVIPPPTGPISLSVSSGSANLSWSYGGSGADGFNIFKSLDGNTYNPIYVLSSSLSRSFIDQNVTMSNTYWYEINAFNSVGTSSFSNTASITFEAVTQSAVCYNSPYPPQLFTESLQVSLSYDLVAAPTGDRVANGGFESGSFVGWTMVDSSTSTDVVNTAPYVHSGSFGASLGAFGTTGSLTQTLTTGNGNSFTLRFWLLNVTLGTPTYFAVKWEGTTVATISNTNLPTYTEFTYPVTATGPTSELQFLFDNEPDFFGLDDISVT